MDTSPITALTNNAAANSPAALARVPQKTLGQDDFLKLLVTQLSAQDPLNPMKDTEFVSQMASFSALEQSKQMEADIANLRSEQRVLQANQLLGRTVQVADANGNVAVGPVTGVQMQAGTPYLVVGGQMYDLSHLVSITSSTTGN